MIFTAILFIVIGIAIKNGKMYYLIAGYNTMSPEEKAKYNIEKIATLFRNVMFGMAGFILLGYGVSKWAQIYKTPNWYFIVVIVTGVACLLLLSNSKAYKNTTEND